MGQSRRFTLALGAYSVWLDGSGSAVQPRVAACGSGAGAGCHGLGGSGFHRFFITDIKPLRAAVAGNTRRGSGPQPIAARSGAYYSSTPAVHGLCRVFCAFCLCHCGVNGRPLRRGMGTVVSSVDQCGLGLSLPGHHVGELVGLLRIGLGRLVVLGSC